MWLDINSSLVPEGHTVVLGGLESVGGDRFGGVGGRVAAGEVAVTGELEVRGGVRVEGLLEEELGGPWFEGGNVWVF